MAADTPAEAIRLTVRCSGLCLLHCHSNATEWTPERDAIVQGVIAQAVREARADERESCAQLAEQHRAIVVSMNVDKPMDIVHFADLIRARTTP